MPEWVTGGLEAFGPYWPFIAKLFVFWFVGQNMKKRVFTKERARTRGWFWAAARGTMWAHPMVAGILWGALYPWMPACDFVGSRGGAITEGVFAGVLSVVAFMALEATAVKYQWTPVLNVMRELGRESIVPPPPEES